MAQKPFTAETVIEAVATFESGIDSGVSPRLLKRNQLSFGTNLTLRGTYASHRPPYARQTLDYGGNASLQAAVELGLWQGACYYRPDAGSSYVIQPWTDTSVVEQLIASIAGRLFLFTPSQTTLNYWSVTEISIPGDWNSATAPQVWLWQAENYVFITDGTAKMPIYYNGTYCRRSIGNNGFSITIASGDANYPPNGGYWNVVLAGAPAYPWAVGTPITGLAMGEYVVASSGPLPTQYQLQRVSTVGPASGSAAAFPVLIYPEFPAGRVGRYGLGRVWMSLTDAKQFIGGDEVFGPSGTSANQYRDAILRTNENATIAGGGAFTTPGPYGDIRAMVFAATLDVSLGQGPLQVLTPTGTFSCYAPTDRTTWASVTNPILTESLITNGAEGYYSTVIANGDVLYRAVDGIRSLILGRRDFATWGNVPISSEMDRILALDNEQYLRYSSAVVFDNRLLMTCDPNSLTGKGIFHNGIIALNFDPISSLRGKAASIYDGLWTGLNVLQLVSGRFVGLDRCFAFTTEYNPNNPTQKTELFEILPTPVNVYSPLNVFQETNWLPDAAIYDYGYVPIVWTGETAALFKAQSLSEQPFLRLLNGEILVDSLQGTVDFEVLYRPDDYPCWTQWFKWSECAPQDSVESKAQFRPRMGLGQPSHKPCDPTTHRSLIEGYTFQFKFIIQGHCRFLGARFMATTLPQPTYAPPQCRTPSTDTTIT